MLRIYATYPLNSDSKPWFHDIEKQVTVNPLRYVIPIDKSKGLIMISYTDGDDTNYWRRLEGPALTTEIQKQTHLLFPEKTIPAPTYLMKHDWPSGCTYWLPGDYDVKQASKAALNPAPNPPLSDPICKGIKQASNCAYIFYVLSDSKGGHTFAATIQDHERNVEAARAGGFLP